MATRRFVLVEIKVPIEIFSDGEYALMEDCIRADFSQLSAVPEPVPARADLSEMYEHILEDILGSFAASEEASEGEDAASEEASEGEDAASEGEDAASKGEDAASKGEDAAPEGEDAASKREDAAPDIFLESHPIGNNRTFRRRRTVHRRSSRAARVS